MRGLRFPIAVAATSLALVAVVAVAGGLVAREVLAGGPWFGGHGFGAGLKLPPAIAGLGELPPEERFAHFRGAQVSLTDKDDQPLTITVTPGTVTAASATSLTLAANDGSSQTFALDEQTIVRGQPAQGELARPAIEPDSRVVVVTLNDSTTAQAVVALGAGGFGPPGGRGFPWR